MLAVFLNRCKSMPQIKASSVFQRFLDPNSSWSEVLNTPPVSNLPKSVLKAPPLDPASESLAHTYLPIPPSSAKLRSQEDPTFKEAELNAKEYENVIVNGLEKVNQRIIKRYSDEAKDLSGLGARFNAFSLEEDGALATSIEMVGQAIDSSYIATGTLVDALSSSFSEPLGESAQFASVVRSVLKFRRQKALQLEITTDNLATKRVSLASLEKIEQEAQRIQAYLYKDSLGENGTHSEYSASIASSRVLSGNNPAAPTSSISEDTLASESKASLSGEPNSPENFGTRSSLSEGSHSIGNGSSYDPRGASSVPLPDEAFPPTHADALPATSSVWKRKSTGFKFPGISKLNNAIHGIIDNDPETTRRNNIGKIREQISQLEIALKAAQTDVEQASDSVKKDMERFQRTKEDDLRQMMRAYIQCHLEWAQNNLESWQRAKAEIEKI